VDVATVLPRRPSLVGRLIVVRELDRGNPIYW